MFALTALAPLMVPFFAFSCPPAGRSGTSMVADVLAKSGYLMGAVCGTSDGREGGPQLS